MLYINFRDKIVHNYKIMRMKCVLCENLVTKLVNTLNVGDEKCIFSYIVSSHTPKSEALWLIPFNTHYHYIIPYYKHQFLTSAPREVYIFQMSSSSNTGGGSTDLRYQYRYCSCERRAALKIVESQKPTKRLLYFVSETKACTFFAWCRPIGRDDEQIQTNYCPTSPNRQAISRESSFDSPGRVLHDSTSFSHHMHGIEHDIRQMKTFMRISVAVALLLLLIAIFRWLHFIQIGPVFVNGLAGSLSSLYGINAK